MSLIEKLTPEQEALIPVYRDKWRKIALSTERIDREKAASAVKAAYIASGKNAPKIIFSESPYVALKSTIFDKLDYLKQELNNKVVSQLNNSSISNLKRLQRDLLEKPLEQLGRQTSFFSDLSCSIYPQVFQDINIDEDLFHELVYSKLDNNFSDILGFRLSLVLENYIRIYLNEQLQSEDWQQINLQLGSRLSSSLQASLYSYINNFFGLCFQPEEECKINSFNDFIITSVWFSEIFPELLIYQSLIKECGWIFTFDKAVIICDRPLHIRLDHQNRLHAEGELAIEYADGFGIYSYHGVTLPEKYGKHHPQQWQAQWLLTENNAELRRVLIQGIGYARICQELQAIELDTWAEYTLLKIDADVDEEPIYLLKMTCPSTGFIHALRVPPDMKSAHEAICWINWGIAPEEFAIQT
ncbi:hypothetical protein NIES37_59490 [Tolypothrix tenuis PCC 7101]|uniref:DUF6745 domain-containing protein n=1 Tax=Tolypothrix tenuis PCC 7101 TaxID=231146 RepID=A0A1Z4N8G5_9CYAN|nr:hypothetical protein [Aulosira sp. FACHB-113]BAZ01942.1 hypothetical protein NIES37_59490 [Tolypothrix tenuis PCC 7101]BAZ74133.1 hypothetical protein NIES50_27040 [Aulosira laxa NIES-50]